MIYSVDTDPRLYPHTGRHEGSGGEMEAFDRRNKITLTVLLFLCWLFSVHVNVRMV